MSAGRDISIGRITLGPDGTSRHDRALNAFLAGQYEDDAEIKFKQVELQNKLLDLFVDLPFQILSKWDEKEVHSLTAAAPFGIRLTVTQGSANYIIEDNDPEKGGAATLLLSEFAMSRLSQVVVEGAPGQGKSTLAQYICQVQRIRWLGKSAELAQLPPHHQNGTLRFPLKVDLRDFSGWLTGSNPFGESAPTAPIHTGPRSLEAFLAELIRHRSGGIDFSADDLVDISRRWPLLIVLDGFDEVADIRGRSEIITATSKAITRLRANCPQIRLVITSRPTAFANSPGFDSQHFPHVILGSVTRDQVTSYTEKWMGARNLTPPDRVGFRAILKEKMEQPHLRDLAKNPMQLTILLSLIHTRGSALPDKRTSLYDAYVDLFFDREAVKSADVRNNVDLLKDLHRYIGWVLHTRSEIRRRKSTMGRIEERELHRLIHEYLDREQHSRDIVDCIFTTMVERVVMIVSRVQGTYEFEVQPLREYFAARYLYNTASWAVADERRRDTKPELFDAIARNFYWLNVTRFFCGCFTKGEHGDLAWRVNDLATDPELGRTRYPVQLGAILLADWVFFQTPRAVSEVVNALSSQEALRKLVPYGSYGGLGLGNRQVIQIPAQCGGSTLVKKAFEVLDDPSTQADFCLGLATWISGNASPKDIDHRWFASPKGGRPDVRSRYWVWVANRLGTLGRAEQKEIRTALGNDRLDQRTIQHLCDAERCDVAMTTDVDAEGLISCILEKTIAPGRIKAASPFYLVPSFLSYVIYGHSVFHDQGLRNAAKDFKTRVNVCERYEFPALARFAEMALPISLRFADIVEMDAALPARTQALEGLVEACRTAWGEQPSIIAAACAIANLPRGRGRIKQANLADRESPLCQRLRFAKGCANDGPWWARQLEDAHERPERLLVHVACWSWASLPTLFSLVDPLSRALDEMQDDEWDVLLEFCYLRLGQGTAPFLKQDGASVTLPVRIQSDRTALLMGLRGDGAISSAIFLNHFRRTSSSNWIVDDFRQVRALDAALAGLIDWADALDIISLTYKQGACFRITRIPDLRGRASEPPSQAIDRILTDTPNYPIHLWSLAETIATHQVLRNVQPLSTVAKRDRWFSDLRTTRLSGSAAARAVT